MIRNSTNAVKGIYYVNYTVFHGDTASIDANPIIITDGNSYNQEMSSFHRIRECFFDQLSNYADMTSVYSGNGPQQEAIKWLMDDRLEYSTCVDNFFIERYALAVINFAAPIDNNGNESLVTRQRHLRPGGLIEDSNHLWISALRQCEWETVTCLDGSVTTLDLGYRSLSGTVASEIGLLTNLKEISMISNQLYGNIPTEIGGLKDSVESISLENNLLTGSMPSEIIELSLLRWFDVRNNMLTGTLMPEIGGMPLLTWLILGENNLTGTLPTQFGKLSNLLSLNLRSNSLSGSIPSEIGELKALYYLNLGKHSNSILRYVVDPMQQKLTPLLPLKKLQGENSLTSTIPSAVGELYYALT